MENHDLTPVIYLEVTPHLRDCLLSDLGVDYCIDMANRCGLFSTGFAENDMISVTITLPTDILSTGAFDRCRNPHHTSPILPQDATS